MGMKQVHKQGSDQIIRRLSCCRKVVAKKDRKTTLLVFPDYICNLVVPLVVNGNRRVPLIFLRVKIIDLNISILLVLSSIFFLLTHNKKFVVSFCQLFFLY